MTALSILGRFWWAVPMLLLAGHNGILRDKLSDAREQIAAEQEAHRSTVANYRAAASIAKALDRQNVELTEALQGAENRRIADDYEARIADARARAAAAGVQRQAAAADPGHRGDAAMPGVPGTAARADEASGQDRLSGAVGTDDALIATEQAIQLDALIDWIEAQARVWRATQQKDTNDE